MTSFSWLHLTDLHLGMPEQPSLFPALKDRFFEDLKPLHEKCGDPWDLVLFTGDLTQSGKADEFARVEEFLAELWEHLTKLGSEPSFLAIPGNHDLVRPKPKAPAVMLLCDWSNKPDVRTEFWNDPDSDYRKTITDAFKNYIDWWGKTPIKKLPVQSGMLPGDFSATFEKEGATLGILGLNTTFLQLTGGDYTGKLALNPLQFQRACKDDGPAWVKKHNACLLLTHQPPDWLTADSLEQLRSDIAPYFALHLFGHMHEARYQSAAEAGGPVYRACQGMSLFGLEHFGEDQRPDRRHGYAVGKIGLQGEEGSFELWPRMASRPGGGLWNFAAASADFVLADERTKPEEFKLLKSIAKVATPDHVVDVGPAPAESGDSSSQRRLAVLIGINDYKSFAKLNFCRNDIVELAGLLRDPLGFDSVLEFHENSDLKPDRTTIFTQLAELRSPKINPDDLLVFYFSGHGIIIGDQDYLLPIEASPKDAKNLGIKVDDLVGALQDTGCKRIAMFIDACREPITGARGTAAIGEESKAVVSKAGIVAFFSCDPRDRSYEIEALQHGSFTYCILKAIKEEAATTVEELDAYLKTYVPQINTENGKPTQQPYSVIETAEQGRLKVLFNPQAVAILDRISAKFYELWEANKINRGLFLGVGQFINSVKRKEQLDTAEKKKVELLQTLYDETMNLEDFCWAWEAAQKAAQLGSRGPRPAIKKLAPLGQP